MSEFVLWWELNEHGIEGRDHRGHFIPRVCWECPLLDGDSDADGWDSWYFCTRYLKMPTRKGTCKTRDAAVTARTARGPA